ncbi:hypothetical protein [Clostridium sp. Marseille-QA1073]
MSLFLKECRNILKTYIYYIFIAVTILFYISQMGITTSEDIKTLLSPPSKIDMETQYAPYGEKESAMSEEMMPKVVGNLYREYKENSYGTYPLGFYKVVKLDNDEEKKIELFLEEITGEPIEVLNLLWEKSSSGSLSVSKDITLDKFNELMASVDKLLGGGSAYGEDFIGRFTRIPITYEEAVEEYEYMMQKDKLTNGYARLFCDYMGIVAGIFPIFVVVFTSIKDRRSKMEELIYFRETSSLKLVLSRYFSLVFMMILPIIILGIKETITFISFANSENLSIDLFAFIKYILWWILPTLMIVTAIGMFLTTLTDTPVAIAVELFIWFFNINNIQLTGDYPLLGLFIRHNNRGKGMLIAENFSEIMTNRLVIAGLAILIVIVTVFIYEQKRRGKLDIGRKMGKWFNFNKNKSKVKYIS